METSKFVKGLVFAWIPLLFFIVPILVSLFREISTQKATGIGAVAGGVSEALATSGLFAIVACEVYAVILLVETFAKGELLKRLVAIVSIGCASLLILLVGALVVWFMRSSSIR
jgi:hypothetical protein